MKCKIITRELAYMHINFDEIAKRTLAKALGERAGYFKLFYDTEGCGCEGINVLLLVDAPLHTDVMVTSDEFQFIVDQQHQIFYNEVVNLAGDPEFPTFKLYSDDSGYGNRVPIRDLRAVDATK